MKHELANYFLQHASEFDEAARRLRSTKPFLYYPTFYCVLHSIELSLKAHLTTVGFTKGRLASRAFGHDLAALLDAAVSEMLIPSATLDAAARRAIKLGSDSYYAKRFEYPEFRITTQPIGKWLRISLLLLRSAQRHIEKA
jgi:hypothetical protein